MQGHPPEAEHPEGARNLPAPQSISHKQAMILARQQAMSLEVRLPEADENDDELDLKSYWDILVKRRWTILGVLGIILATSFVGTLLMTPIYRATAVVQIDRDIVQIVQVEGMPPVEGAGDSTFYQTQYELLNSRALAERVVKQMNLVGGKDLAALSPPSPWARLFGGGDEDGATPAPTSSQDQEARLRQAVGMFRGGISIEPVRNSRLVRINYDSPNAEFSIRAANAIADSYIANNLERRFGSSSYAKSYLEDRLQEIKLKLEQSERKLVEFAQKEEIVGGDDTASLSQQNLTAINAALSQAKQERIRAETRWKQAQLSPETSLLAPAGTGPTLIQTLKENRSKLMADYQDKLRLYKPAYPLMQQLKGQIDEIDKQIAAERGNTVASYKAEYIAAQEQEKLLTDQLKGLKSEVLDLQNRSIQYNIYKREVDTNRQLYDGLLQRYKEIGVAGGVTSNNISLVDRADAGRKFKPSMSRNLTLGLGAGLMLGVLLALLLEYLDDSIKSPEDVEKLLRLSLLGVVPKLKDGQVPARALEDPRSPFAEAYRSVRTALQFATDQGVPRVLLVTSSAPGEGKSTTAMTLAKNFAQIGKRVLLIDADLRNPSLHREMGAENGAGLSNLLSGAAKAPDVMKTSTIPNLSYISSGPLPPNPAELLMGSKMLSLLTIASQKFDQVIIDAPPVMGLADAPILSNLSLGTLLVVEAGETRVAMARNAIKRLAAARGYVIGALLTKYQAGTGGLGGYGGYNYYSYGEPSNVRKLGRQ